MAKKIYIGVPGANLVVNGDFSNGTTDWIKAVTADNMVVSDKTLIFTLGRNISSYTNLVRSSVNYGYTLDHVYYYKVSIKVPSTVTGAMVYFAKTAAYATTSDEWQTISNRITISGDISNLNNTAISLNISAGSSGNIIYYKDIELFDLTELYGSGSEPSKSWCDSHSDELKAKHGIAQKIKKIYIGVNGVARKVKKGYIGVNGVAKQFFKNEDFINFSSSPLPRNWTNVSNNKMATSSNSYGVWTIEARYTYSTTSTYDAKNAVDGSASTYCMSTSLSSIDSYQILTLSLPAGCSINPTEISVTHRYCGNASYPAIVQGYDGNDWVDLITLARNASSSNETFSISGDTYYTKFGLKLYRYNTSYQSPYVYEFDIPSGTLKIE